MWKLLTIHIISVTFVFWLSFILGVHFGDFMNNLTTKRPDGFGTNLIAIAAIVVLSSVYFLLTF